MTLPLYRLRAPWFSAERREARSDTSADGRRHAMVLPHRKLDRTLELIEQRRLSVREVRLLLALVEREASLPELAAVLGRRTGEVRRTAARLYSRGLVACRHAGKRRETRLGLTPAGLATAHALLSAAGARDRERRATRGLIPAPQ